MILFRWSSFISSFFVCGTLIGQIGANQPKVWNLEQCIDYALKNNIQLKQNELNTELSQVNLIQSKANLLPNLNANAAHSYNIGRTVDRFTNTFADAQVLSQNFGLSSDITLFSGWQNINSIQEFRYSYLASKMDIDKMKNDVSLNIATAYLQVLFAIETLDITRNQIGITTAQVERTKKLVEAGASAKGNLLDIEAQLASEELNVTNADNQLTIAYLSLAQLLNLTSSEDFSITKPELTIAEQLLLEINPAQVFSLAVTNLPEIKSAELKVKSASKAVSIAWGGLSPRLSFNATYGTGYSGLSQRLVTAPSFQGYQPNGDITSNHDTVFSPTFSNPTLEKTPFSEQYKNNVNKTFGFYLTVPLFNRFQSKTLIEKARIQKSNAELVLESTKLQIQKTIQQAYADANAALKKYLSSQKALLAMKESFNYTEQKYNVGMININDYNTAKNKLTKTESDLLQAKYEFVFKTKVLDFYQGKPLKL